MAVDFGASCSIMSEETFRQIDKRQIPIESTPTKLLTWSKETLPTVGKATVSVMFKGHKAVLPVMVVAQQGRSLMGRNWFRPLGIESHGIRHVSTSDEALTARFPEVFCTDLRGFKGAPIHIELNDVHPKFEKVGRCHSPFERMWPRSWTAWKTKASWNQPSTPTGPHHSLG
ncbi:unnamed protein product [Ixodes hexagonus]